MRKAYITILTFALACSCSDKGETPQDENEQTVTEIAVLKGMRTNKAPELSEGEAEDLTKDDFDEESLLYISQRGTSMTPDFSENSNNCYIYRYQENREAEWDHEYNFFPKEEKTHIINWSTIKQNGPVGNAFWLFAMYFPVDNQIRFGVETNQTKLENFQKSDIMGAYHATSSLFTRLRFRLHHLMVYLKVTLYVPVAKPDEDGNGYSGFNEDAFHKAIVQNAITDFTIDWTANRSSDVDPPLTQNNSSTRSDIIMHKRNEQLKEETINVKDFYNKDNPSYMIDKDNVRVYHFDVIFPGNQNFGDNFLRFQFRTPGEVSDKPILKNYYFSASQLITNNDYTYSLTQGTLQHLRLYLPRYGNQTILVGANIIPWTDASTEMTVTKDENKPEESQ